MLDRDIDPPAADIESVRCICDYCDTPFWTEAWTNEVEDGWVDCRCPRCGDPGPHEIFFDNSKDDKE